MIIWLQIKKSKEKCTNLSVRWHESGGAEIFCRFLHSFFNYVAPVKKLSIEYVKTEEKGN